MEKEIKVNEIFYHIELSDGSVVECNLGISGNGNLFEMAAHKMRDSLLNGVRILDEKNGIMKWYSPYMIKQINAPIDVFSEAIKLNLKHNNNEAIKIIERVLDDEYNKFQDVCDWLTLNDNGQDDNKDILTWRDKGVKLTSRINLLEYLVSQISI